MRDFLEVQDIIKQTFENDSLVNMVTTNASDVNMKHTSYWCIVYEANSRTQYEEYSTYNYNIYAINKHIDTPINTTDENYSLGMLIIQNFINNISEEYDIDTQLPLTYNFSNVKFADICDVVSCNINIIIMNETDCN
jgi:hypothetical protein